jgi:hypothetical protein
MASAVASSSSSLPSPSQTTSADKRKQQPSSSSSHTRNPVALRLYKVLSTNFEDAATREALQTLSDLYAPSTSTKGKEPVKSIDDDVTDDDDDVEHDDEDIGPSLAHDGNTNLSWGGPSTVVEVVPGEIAARARKNLRRDMEKKLAEGSRQFLKALGEVDQVCVSVSFSQLCVHDF